VEDLTLSVASHNEPAIGLYRRFGFTEYGHDRRALKVGGDYVDELLMRLVL
jgi:RimJ/RimL family protein N-acetyltransferase